MTEQTQADQTQPARHRAAIAISDEQVAHLPYGVDLVFQTFGDANDPALLLVMGLSGPLNWWHPDLCGQFAEAGYHVIRFDNRDAGRSTWMSEAVTSRTLLKAFLGLRVPAPYTLDDMARDAVGLLDHLRIDAAHVVGVSMGGMIAQTLAIRHPERVLSLASIMSSTGRRRVGWQHPKLIKSLLTDRTRSREAYVEGTVRYGPTIGSPAYPEDPATARARAIETWERGVNRAGSMRQMVAILTQPDRTEALGGVQAPTLVLHGLSDPMVHRSGGQATASAVGGSMFVSVLGMGHNLPPGLWDLVVGSVVENARRA